MVEEVTVDAVAGAPDRGRPRALRVDHGPVDERGGRSAGPAVHGRTRVSSSRCRRAAFERTSVYAGMEMETEIHLAIARVFADHDALVCPTFGGLGLRAGEIVRRRHRRGRPAPRALHLRGAHPRVQRRQPPPGAGRPVGPRVQRRPHGRPGGRPVRTTTSPPSTWVRRPSASSVCGTTPPGAPLSDRPTPAASAPRKETRRCPSTHSRDWVVLGAGALACTLAVTACGAKPPAKNSTATTDYTVLTPKPTAAGRRRGVDDVPGDPDPGPDQGVRLPREHRRPAAVRLAAAPGPGPDAGPRHRDVHGALVHRVRLHAELQGARSGTAHRSRRRTPSSASSGR